MFYTAKTPKLVAKLFPASTWHMDEGKKELYLTFDDGPHPQITPFVLDQLAEYQAKATFFCIGKNVVQNPGVYARILAEGHSTGNHTHDHVNGWKTPLAAYLQNVAAARRVIDSNLFRPPYGRITRAQHQALRSQENPFKIVMWSVLSGDFDTGISPVQCCTNVTRHAKAGAIIVFHDSEKAFERLKYALPEVLKYFSEKGFQFEKISS